MENHYAKHPFHAVKCSLAVVAIGSLSFLTPGDERNVALVPESSASATSEEPGCRRLSAETDRQSGQFLAQAVQNRVAGTDDPYQSVTPELAGSLLAFAAGCGGKEYTGNSTIVGLPPLEKTHQRDGGQSIAKQ